jgi:hypothetical protein
MTRFIMIITRLLTKVLCNIHTYNGKIRYKNHQIRVWRTCTTGKDPAAAASRSGAVMPPSPSVSARSEAGSAAWKRIYCAVRSSPLAAASSSACACSSVDSPGAGGAKDDDDDDDDDDDGGGGA